MTGEQRERNDTAFKEKKQQDCAGKTFGET